MISLDIIKPGNQNFSFVMRAINEGAQSGTYHALLPGGKLLDVFPYLDVDGVAAIDGPPAITGFSGPGVGEHLLDDR
jgi:hypothetical protein